MNANFYKKMFLFFIFLLSKNICNFYEIDPATNQPFYFRIPYYKKNKLNFKAPNDKIEYEYIKFKEKYINFFNIINKYKDYNFEEKTIISINIPAEENIEIPYNLMKKNEIHDDLTVYKSDKNNFIVKISNNNLSIEIRKKFFYKNKYFIDLLNLEYDLYN